MEEEEEEEEEEGALNLRNGQSPPLFILSSSSSFSSNGGGACRGKNNHLGDEKSISLLGRPKLYFRGEEGKKQHKWKGEKLLDSARFGSLRE